MKYSNLYKILSVTVFMICALFINSVELLAQEVEQYYVIYHDAEGKVIYRFQYNDNYTFDASYPVFFTGLNYTNTAWNTKADGSGTSYVTGAKLDPISEDLNVYAVLKEGHFVRFNSNGGTPIEYQFVDSGDKAKTPTIPSRSGYDFDGWFTDDGTFKNPYDFNAKVESDVLLYGKWVPKDNTPYTVRLWLENANHANRSNITLAINNAKSDYTYVSSFTKYGTTGGKVDFTDADKTREQIKAITYANTGDIYDFPIYFYDDEHNSHAKSLTEYNINEINKVGLSGDGSTIINVYYRRLVFNATLTTQANLRDLDGNPFSGETYDFEIRNGENLKSSIQRNSVQINSKLDDILKLSLYDIPYNFRFKSRDGYQNAGRMVSYDRTFNAVAMYSHKRMPTGVVFEDNDPLNMILEHTNIGPVEFHRYTYLETLESAKKGLEKDKPFQSVDLSHYDQPKSLEDVYMYEIDKKLSSYTLSPKSGYSLHFIQIIDRSNPDAPVFYPEKLYDDYTGEPHSYIGSSTYPPMPYRLESFQLRNSYDLFFETYNFKTFTKSENPQTIHAYYEEPIRGFADRIYSEDVHGHKYFFIMNETSYVDDNLTIWIFKGWYDNELFDGSPIDISTTTITMPSKNMHLYAKWEPKLINAEYNGNGGKIEGQEKIDKVQQCGKIPVRPEDPIPPKGMKFYCWTINDKYYGFNYPIYVDTELKATYYNENTSLTVIYNAGKGSGTVPHDTNIYLFGANPKIIEPTSALIAPKGKKFKCWLDDNKNIYNPGDELTITRNVTLTAQYEDIPTSIIIRRKGLNDGENAIYSIYWKESTESPDASYVKMFTLSMNNENNKPLGKEYAERVIRGVKAGIYKVVEDSWTWTYSPDTDPEVSPETARTGKGTNWTSCALETSDTAIFTFDGAFRTDKMPKHGEGSANNLFQKYGLMIITVEVKDWQDGGREHISF